MAAAARARTMREIQRQQLLQQQLPRHAKKTSKRLNSIEKVQANKLVALSATSSSTSSGFISLRQKRGEIQHWSKEGRMLHRFYQSAEFAFAATCGDRVIVTMESGTAVWNLKTCERESFIDAGRSCIVKTLKKRSGSEDEEQLVLFHMQHYLHNTTVFGLDNSGHLTRRCYSYIDTRVGNGAVVELSNGNIALTGRALTEIWNPRTGTRLMSQPSSDPDRDDFLIAAEEVTDRVLVVAFTRKSMELWHISEDYSRIDVAASTKLKSDVTQISSISLTARNGVFLTLSKDGLVRGWSSSDLTCVSIYNTNSPITSMCELSNGSLVVGTKSGDLELWRLDLSLIDLCAVVIAKNEHLLMEAYGVIPYELFMHCMTVKPFENEDDDATTSTNVDPEREVIVI